MTIDKIEPVRTHTKSGAIKWILKMHDKNMNYREEEFDRVLVTTGPFQKRYIPKLEGMDVFGGQILHSQAYKEWVKALPLSWSMEHAHGHDQG